MSGPAQTDAHGAVPPVPDRWATWVGARVVLRRGRPEGGTADVLGELLRADATSATVLTRRGEVTVPAEEVLAGKQVPPPAARRGAPHRAPSADDLARVAAASWPGVDTERLGDWLLRAGGGFTSRANSTLAVGDPGLPLPQAVAAVRRWYAARDLPPRIALVGAADSGVRPDDPLEVLLRLAGWERGDDTRVLTAATAEVAGLADTMTPVVWTDAPDAAWSSCFRQDTGLPAVASDVLLAGPSPRFARVVIDDQVIAVARLVLDQGWAGLSAVEVREDHRGAGHGRALVGAVAAQALAAGIRSMHLQVVDDDTAAQRFWSGLGFTEHHRYHYRTG